MKYEIKRKALHIFAAAVPIVLIYAPWRVIIAPLLIFTALTMLADLFRTRSRVFKKMYGVFFGDILRDHEHRGEFTGATCFFMSLSLSYIVFHLFLGMDMRFIAVIYSGFMIGDAAAALVGKKFGKIKLVNSKTLEGSIAFFIASAVSTFWIVPAMYFYVLICAMILTIMELIVIKLDDNLFVTLLTTLIVFFLV